MEKSVGALGARETRNSSGVYGAMGSTSPRPTSESDHAGASTELEHDAGTSSGCVDSTELEHAGTTSGGLRSRAVTRDVVVPEGGATSSPSHVVVHRERKP